MRGQRPAGPRALEERPKAMTDPVQFLVAAMLYHPAAPYLAFTLVFGLVSIAVITLETRSFGPARNLPARNLPARNPAAATAIARPAKVPAPADNLTGAAIDCVPVLDPARAQVLEHLEDVVECLGRAQRVLPDIALSRALRIRPDPGAADQFAAARRALNRASLDFAVFSYQGHLDLALMIGPRSDDDPARGPIETALGQAGVPLLRIPPDASPALLRARIQPVFSSNTDASRAA